MTPGTGSARPRSRRHSQTPVGGAIRTRTPRTDEVAPQPDIEGDTPPAPFFAPDPPEQDRSQPLVPIDDTTEPIDAEPVGSRRLKNATRTAPVAGGRLQSLDAFRGLTIVAMLLVNNIAVDADAPEQLTHAAWGKPITFADLVFPWFLFIAGAAIPFSAHGRREAGLPLWRRGLLMLQRTAVLFGLGMFIDSSLAHAPVFGLSILQLIALTYLIGRVAYHFLPTLWRAGLAAALLGCYGWALLSLRAPGEAAVRFTEDHNIVQHLNDTVLMRFSLEGLPSVLPTAALVIVGTVCGDLLRSKRLTEWRRAVILCAGGAALLGIGWVWGHTLVMHKSVWTPSYICYAAGWGAVCLATLYALVDLWGMRVLALPLVIFGTNALIAYAGAVLFKVYILQDWYTHSALTGERVVMQQGALDWCVRACGGDRFNGGILYTAIYIFVWWVVCAVLYRRRIHVRA